MCPNDADGMANSVDPDQTAAVADQTAPLGAVWSGSALFAQAYLSENGIITVHYLRALMEINHLMNVIYLNKVSLNCKEWFIYSWIFKGQNRKQESVEIKCICEWILLLKKGFTVGALSKWHILTKYS